MNNNTNGMGGGFRPLSGSRGEGRAARIERLAAQREQIRVREEQMREREDRLVQTLTDRMNAAINDRNMDSQVRINKIENFKNQNQMILEKRAQRESELAEQEAMITQMVLEETTRREERQSREERYEDEEQAEDRRERRSITNLTEIAVSQDNLHELRRVRHTLAHEALHLEQAMDSIPANFVKMGINEGIVPVEGISEIHAPVDIIVSHNPMRGNNNFVNNQHQKLTEGIGRIDAAITTTIANMYSNSLKMQEDYLDNYRQEQEGEQDERIDEEV